MVRRLAASVFLVVGVAVLAAGVAPAAAGPLAWLKPAGCGLCTEDDDCGSGHKCCRDACPEGEYRCLMVSTCP